ncbi:EF-hand domain [Dillenia turbinata]|uniref:EF-hand domain n=1 Tax=Dillenia turbinata TaxID=194707 RepID=A0AAN8ZDV1_9MAGN
MTSTNDTAGTSPKFLLPYKFLFCNIRLHNFVSSIFQPMTRNALKVTNSNDIDPLIAMSGFEDTKEDVKLSSDEMKVVMERIGLRYDSEEEEIEERVGEDELKVVFENEPCLDEVMQCFDVFDENRDGVIDVVELQRVLCNLGFREGCQVEKCKAMIRTFDENGDGVIDFHEFVKLMEKCLS